MLTKIIIKNLAIIKSAQIDFKEGFNVITGETGAGKSMLIDALTLISGGRANTDLIREGEEFCEVQGLFSLEHIPEMVKKQIADSDIDINDELIIRRIIQKNGKSRAYINDVVVTQGYLESLGQKLVSILSQHEHQSLFESDFQLELLDRFLNSKKRLEELHLAYRDWKELESKYTNLKGSQDEYLKRLDYLKYQINEIREHDFKEGEEEELLSLVSRADNALLVLKTLYGVRDIASYGDDSMSMRLSPMVSELSKIENIEPGVQKVLELLNEATIKLDDMAKEADRLAKSYDFDEAEVEEKRIRLSELKRLKKKFGCEDLCSIIKSCEEMESELKSLENLEETLENLSSELKTARLKYDKISEDLSLFRQQNSPKLSKQIELVLEDLGLFKGGFRIKFTKAEASLTGIDKVEYLISTNPGEPEKPISKIASGGEMSRLMLAIQTATNKVYGYGIQIFDEVDAGIGGDVAFKVGGLLKKLSANCQLIVITHLPQIAVFADQHIKVWKEAESGRTKVMVNHLDIQTKFNEVTRMLGMENHSTAVDNVKEMICKAKKLLQSNPL
jgi:DNA repair protein RecN (Recombination protein N)